MDGPGPGAGLVRRRHRNEADADNSQSQQQTADRNAIIANANANADVHASVSANFTVTERRNGEHHQHQDPQHYKLYKQLKATSIILHTASILILIIGFLLRSHLHNGSDCDMTYSHREFIPVDTTPLHHPIYKLYQFHDSRQVREAVPNNQTHAVLYVPGHWGSHTQCRSVGAHGIQLTRADEPHYKVQRLNKMTMMMKKKQQQQPQQDDAMTTTTTTTTTRQDFIYDTYCIDFAEQGGGMHASLLTAQRDYVDQLVLHYFQGRAMTIVGHSMGGLVATKTNNQITVLTLATPHAAFPYSLDESIHHFYRLPSNANRMVVSISGGFKDELIPPALCELIVGSNTTTITSMTLQTSRIMRKHHKSGLPLLGMDHKAIVWCHEVLSYVRTVIYQLSRGDPIQTLREMSRNAPAYQSTVQQQKKEYGEHYGSWALLSVECAMLYNAELLLGLFAMNCGLHHGNNRVLLLPRMRMQMQKMLMIPIAAGCLAACWSNHNVSLGGIIILSYVASTVMAVVAMVANLLPSKRRPSFVIVVGFFMMAFGYRSIIIIQQQHHQQHPGDGSASFISEMVMMSSMVMWTGSIFHLGESLDTLIVVSLPCLVAGKAVAYYKWSFQQELHGLDDSMLRFLVMVVIPMGIRLVLRQQCHCPQHHYVIIFVRIMVVIAVASGGMLQEGGGYRVGYIIGAMSMVDALFTLIGGMRKQK
jgi:PGAP1-like protein